MEGSRPTFNKVWFKADHTNEEFEVDLRNEEFKADLRIEGSEAVGQSFVSLYFASYRRSCTELFSDREPRLPQPQMEKTDWVGLALRWISGVFLAADGRDCCHVFPARVQTPDQDKDSALGAACTALYASGFQLVFTRVTYRWSQI